MLLISIERQLLMHDGGVCWTVSSLKISVSFW